MRTIKFRGKRLDNGEWAYGSLLQGESQSVIATIKSNSINVHDCFEVDPDSVGQFTGLSDRNGKEIYEGDIVRDNKGAVDVITYDSLAFNLCVAYASSLNGVCATFFGDNNPLKDLEVIGNIHDTPGLLNGK